MITNLHYFEFYKPYMLQGEDKKHMNMSDGAYKKYNKRNKSYLLFAKRQEKVIDFTRNLSIIINQIKESTHYLCGQMIRIVNKQYYNENKMINDFIFFVDDLLMQLEKAVYFSYNQNKSQVLVDYGQFLVTCWNDNKSFLSMVGFSMKKLHEEKDISRGDIVKYEMQLQSFFASLEERTEAFLKRPLSSHLSFTSLDYFLNYKYDFLTVDRFSLLETGILLDIAV